MTNPNSSLDELSEKIERMVTEHVAAVRAAAQAAVARACDNSAERCAPTAGSEANASTSHAVATAPRDL